VIRRFLSRCFGVLLVVLGIGGLVAVTYAIFFADREFEWGSIGAIAVSLLVIQMGRWRFVSDAQPLVDEDTHDPEHERATARAPEAADALLTHVEFRSTAFPACESDAERINPEHFGIRLAEYLSAELRKRGENVGDIAFEDWGVRLPIEGAGFDTWIGLGNYPEYPNGFLCFIEPHTEYVRTLSRFWEKVPTRQRIEALRKRVDDALRAHQDVHHITWSTYERFNHIAGP
jgi:hypothetical protein